MAMRKRNGLKPKEFHELEFQRGWHEFNWDTVMHKLKEYWKTYRYLDDVLSHIGSLKGKQILDVGCGIISVLNIIKDAGGICYGIDPLMDQYKKLYHLDTSITWLAAPGENIPFGDANFDVAFCTNVLDHTGEPQKVIFEINRVLKKAGYLVLTTDTFQKEELRDPAHPHCFDNDAVHNLVQTSGFEIIFERTSLIRAQVYRYLTNSLADDHVKEKILVLQKSSCN